MSKASIVREAALAELRRRAAKGQLSQGQLKQVEPLLEQGINVPNLVALGYLSPLNATDPAQIKRAATAYRKSLEMSPAARLRERVAGGREQGTTEFFEEDLAPIITRSPEELYGSVLIPNVGDTTATGRIVTRYGGFEPEIPIESHGGPDFSRQMKERGLPYGWASNRDAAAKKQTQFNEVARTTEREPVAVTTAMGYDANFFAAPYADAFIQKARQLKIPAKDAKVFDEMVRSGVGNINKKTGKMQYSISPFPDWVGINHPEARDQLLGLNGYPNIGARRVTVMTAAAKQKKFREMGFPVVEDIHRAMQMEGAEGLQRGDAGFTLYKPEVGAEVEPIDFHQSYDTGILGQYFGQIEGVSVPPEIMFPDIMADYAARGKSRADAIGGFMMNTGLHQVADQKWLDTMSRYLEANPEQRSAMLKALAGAGIITASSQSQAGPLTYAKGGAKAAQDILDSQAENLRSVFPAPQRFFDPEDRAYKPFLGEQFEPQAGGRYLQMGEGAPQDITGEYPDYGKLSVSPEGKPSFQVSRDQATAPATKGGRKIKTNLFKRKAGWKWTQAPEGFDPDPAGDFPLISVEDGKQHYYTLSTEFPEGVELARYEKSSTEPRLRPTRQGSVELGEVVGEISVRGKKHPVYNRATVKGIAGSGMAVGTAGLTLTSEDADASLLGVGSTIGKKAQDMLGMAMTMRERGLKPSEIWNKTGWEFNEADGRWRTEHNNYENTKVTMPERAGTYKFWDLVDDPVLRGAYDSDSSGRVMDMYGLESAGGTPFESLQVEITPYLPPNDAEIRGPFIRVGEGTSPEEFRKTMLHELQHVIQQKESFASGGNTDMFIDRRDMLSSGEFDTRMDVFNERVRLANDFVSNPPESATFDQMRQAYQILETDKARIEAMRAYERDSLQGQRSPFQMYEALTGEVEARNIEERDQPLSSTRKFNPEATEDPRFPRGQQIALDESRSPYYDEDYNQVRFRSSAPNMNYPRQVTIGETQTPEASYDIVDRAVAVPAGAAAYDYGGGANIPMRPEPAPTAPDLMNQASREFESGIMPVGLGGDPYSFLMAGGMDQGEAARTMIDVYTNIGRGAGTETLGSLGELETLLLGGLLPAIVGVGYGSPIDRAIYGMSAYDPMFPNAEDADRMLPEFLPNLTDLDPESEEMARMFGGLLSPL